MLPHLTGVYRFHVNRLALSLLSLHCPPYARIKPLPTYISLNVSLSRRYKYKKQGHLIWTVILYHYSLFNSPPKTINEKLPRFQSDPKKQEAQYTIYSRS